MDFNTLKDIAKKNKSTLRKQAGGEACYSSIIGYYNQPILKDKKHFIGHRYVCRKTKVPVYNFLEKICEKMSSLYKELDPIEYELQLEEYNKIDPRFKIPNSIFTTITVNYNLECSKHRDEGNYRNKSIILVLGNFKGCNLIIDDIEHTLKDGNYMIIDGSKEHYNTKLIEGERISLVFYIREGMSKCHNEKWIDNRLYLINDL